MFAQTPLVIFDCGMMKNNVGVIQPPTTQWNSCKIWRNLLPAALFMH